MGGNLTVGFFNVLNYFTTLDDANAAIHYNREILQTALDHVRQGIAVFDKDLQLICWNRQFGELLELPPSLTP